MAFGSKFDDTQMLLGEISSSGASDDVMTHFVPVCSSTRDTISYGNDNDDDDDDSDDKDFFTGPSTISEDTEEFLEACTSYNTFEQGLQTIAEEDGEARLVRIMSWVTRGNGSTSFESVGSSSKHEMISEPGREKLESWMKMLKARKREQERRLRRERRRKQWAAVSKLVSRSRSPGEPASSSSSPAGNGGIRRSCVSDLDMVKKGNKFFRARRRVANVFRKVERPVESKIAKERFLID